MFKIISFPIVAVATILVKLARLVLQVFIILLVAVITAFVGLVREKW